MTTTTATPTGFLKLPAELRNAMYGLVSDSKCDSPIDLLSAAPPPKDLILVCREIYAESGKLYKACYRKFWSKHDFVLQLDGGRAVTESEVMALDVHGLNHIRSLKACYIWADSCYKLLDVRGGWVGISRPNGRPLFYLFKQGHDSGQRHRLRWHTFAREKHLRDQCDRQSAGVTMHEQLLYLLWS